MFNTMIEKLKKAPKRLVFTEGWEPRIQEAASRLKKENILEPILLGNREEIDASAKKHGFFCRRYRKHRSDELSRS